MIRWLLVGSLLFGLGTGLRRGWIQLNWSMLADDLNMPFLSDEQALQKISDDLYREDKSSRQAR